MKIKILGTRAKVEAKQPRHIKHTGILIDDKILLDLGEKEFLSENPKYIFFTHLHPDHAFFEYPGEEFKAKNPLEIYAPQKTKKINEAKIINAHETIHLGEYKITAIPVIHSLKVRSFGYIIEKDSKRIFFSGDVAWIEKKDRNKFGKLDLIITEGSFIRKGGMIRRDEKSGNIFGHTGIPDLVKIFQPYTSHIVILHLGTWFLKNVTQGREKIQNLSAKNLKVEPAYDGQIFEV